MLLRNIKIAGFKSIDKEVSIPLAPITLIFGANGSGKSTVFHALLYLYEIVCKGNFDPTISSKSPGGNFLNGFENLVHSKNIERNIEIEVELEVSRFILDSCLTKSDEFFLGEYLQALTINEPDVQVVSLKFEIGMDETEGVIVKRFTSFVNGRAFGSLFKQELKPEVQFQCLFGGHKLIEEIYGDEDLCDMLLDGLGGGQDPIIIDDLGDALPISSSRLQIADSNWSGLDSASDPTAGKLYAESILSQLTISPLRILSNELEKLIHVGPIREIPTRGYVPNTCPQNWYSGLGAWDRFAYGDDSLKSKVNSLFSGQGFSSRYEFKTFGEFQNIRIIDKELDTSHDPAELGVGISQVFPVVVSVADAKAPFVAVEQPELHVHPAWQLIIGDMLIEGVISNPNRMFFIETHSEHIILRLLKRIKLKEGDVDYNKSLLIDNERLSVICVYKDENGKPYYQRQKITENGDFELDWPEGFFEERYGEI